MSRQARVLVILATMGLVAVGALAWVARYYGRVLHAREVAPQSQPSQAWPAGRSPGFAEADLEAFIDVRRRLKRAAADWPPEDLALRETALSRLRVLRDRLCEERAVRAEVYLEVRRCYRIWRGGGPGLRPSQRRMFEERRGALRAIDLESLEPYDL